MEVKDTKGQEMSWPMAAGNPVGGSTVEENWEAA